MNEFVNYGMKEIKPSFKDRVNNFIVMHPIIVALVIMFVISLMFGGCQRAKAAPLEQKYQVYFDSLFSECSNYSTAQQYIDILYSNCNDFIYVSQNVDNFVVVFMSENGETAIDVCNNFSISNLVNGNYLVRTRDYGYAFGMSEHYFTYGSSTNYIGGSVYVQNNLINIFFYSINPSSSFYNSQIFDLSSNSSSTSYFYSPRGSLNFSKIYGSVTIGNSTYISGRFYVKNNNTLLGSDNNSSASRTVSSFAPSSCILDVPELYDSAFEIYKTYGVGGINDPILHVGYTETLSSQGYPYNSYTSYTLTFDVDGTSVPVTVSSDGVYSDYFVDTSTNLPMEFIYRMLQNQLLNFSDANSVRLTNVSMSATFYPTTDFTIGTPETYTKSTLCDLTLKGSSGSVIDYTPPETVHPNFIQVTQQTYFDNRSGFISSGSTYDVPQWADEVKIAYVEDFFSSNFATVENYLNENYDYVVYGNTLSSLVFQETLTAEQEQNLYDLSTLAYDLLSTAASYFNITLSNSSGSYHSVSWDSITPTMQRTIYSAFAKQINLDYILQSSDVISLDCIALIGADASNQISQLSYDSRSKYFTTRYFTRLNTFALGNVQYAIEANSAIAQNTYDLLYAYLDHMDSELLDSLGLNNSYLQSVNTLLNSMLDALGRILDALADLHLDQLDTIDAKLTTIISNMGQSGGGGSVSVPDEDDTIEEAIKYYLLCEDGIGVERAIFEDKFSVWFTGKWHLWLQGKKANGTAPEDNHFFIIGESIELVTNAYDFLTSEPYFWRLFSSWFDSLAGNDNGGEFNEYLTTFGQGYYNPDHYNGINE